MTYKLNSNNHEQGNLSAANLSFVFENFEDIYIIIITFSIIVIFSAVSCMLPIIYNNFYVKNYSFVSELSHKSKYQMFYGKPNRFLVVITIS